MQASCKRLHAAKHCGLLSWACARGSPRQGSVRFVIRQCHCGGWYVTGVETSVWRMGVRCRKISGAREYRCRWPVGQSYKQRMRRRLVGNKFASEQCWWLSWVGYFTQICVHNIEHNQRRKIAVYGLLITVMVQEKNIPYYNCTKHLLNSTCISARALFYDVNTLMLYGIGLSQEEVQLQTSERILDRTIHHMCI